MKRDRNGRAMFNTKDLFELSDGQKEVISLVKDGHNIFFSGAAGTGKTEVLKRILKDPGRGFTYATATTGIAASHIKGVTINSFAGIGIGKRDARYYTNKMHKKVKINIQRAKTVIIDEISMMGHTTFELLDEVFRIVRCQREKPFGGVQLVVCGDFYQLPPIEKGEKFVYMSPIWRQTMTKEVMLTKVFRQKDVDFVTFVNGIRDGIISPETQRILTEMESKWRDDDVSNNTKLCSKNVQVQSINNDRISSIESNQMVFKAIDKIEVETGLNHTYRFENELVLKVGAKVMLLKNIYEESEGGGGEKKLELVNGLCGVVRGFRKDIETGADIVVTDFPSIRRIVPIMTACEEIELDKVVVANRTQIPLTLAWAITIHKSQGMSLDNVEIDLAGMFASAQAYVAISRVTGFEGLMLKNVPKRDLKRNVVAFNYYADFKKVDGSELLYRKFF